LSQATIAPVSPHALSETVSIALIVTPFPSKFQSRLSFSKRHDAAGHQCLWSTSFGSPAEAILPGNRDGWGASGTMVCGGMPFFFIAGTALTGETGESPQHFLPPS